MMSPAAAPASTPVPAERLRLRGRPPKGHAPVIDRDILVVARRIFAERGYRRTSIEAILAAAGVAKRTLYLRYPDKKTLFKAVVRQAVIDAAPPQPAQFVDLADCIRSHVEGSLALRRHPEMRALIEGLSQGEDEGGELAQASHELMVELGVQAFSQELVAVAARQRLTLADPELLAQTVIDLANAEWERERAREGGPQAGPTPGFAHTLAALLITGPIAPA